MSTENVDAVNDQEVLLIRVRFVPFFVAQKAVVFCETRGNWLTTFRKECEIMRILEGL